MADIIIKERTNVIMAKKKELNVTEFKSNARPVDFREYAALRPMKAIKLKCLDCCCYSMKEVMSCRDVTCPLNQYVMSGFHRVKDETEEEDI